MKAQGGMESGIIRAHVPETVAGLGLFYTTAVLGQRAIGSGLRLSAASWVVGPGAGAVIVTLGSCVAGHGAILSGNVTSQVLLGSNVHIGHSNNLQSTTAFCAAGLLGFRILGGQWRMICPSDLRFLGAYSKMGLPCTEEYLDPPRTVSRQ